MLIDDERVQAAFNALEQTAQDLPEARGRRVYLEAASKSIKAKLMADSKATSVAAKECDAYAHSNYEIHIEGLREAVIEEEKLRLYRDNAAITIDAWRTQQSTLRSMGKIG